MPLEARELTKIGLIRTKLANQKLNLDMFLDTVQLHNPAASHPVVDTDNANLDSIKDKVDTIAARIFQREGSNASGGAEDELWLQFRNELEKAGFSREVLRRNQVWLLVAYYSHIAANCKCTKQITGCASCLHSPTRRAAHDFGRRDAHGSWLPRRLQI